MQSKGEKCAVCVTAGFMKSYLVLSKEREYLFCTYFCQTMKIPFKAIAALIILSLIGVFAYQAYWSVLAYT